MAAPAFGAGQQVLTLRPDQSRAIQSRCAASQSFAAFTNASNAPPLSSSARLSAGSSGRSATVARRACRSRTWRTSSLWLRRVGFRSRYRGPALVKTRSREFVRVDRETFRHSRPRGDDNTFGRVRPHGGGGCGNGEQSDSHEPGNRSMSRHEDLLRWSDRPLSVGHGNFAKVQQRCDTFAFARIHRRTRNG